MRTLTVWLVVAVGIAALSVESVTGNAWWFLGLLVLPIIWLMIAVDW